MPESGKLIVFCRHTTFNTNIKKKNLFGGKQKYHSGKCFLLNLYFTCPNGQVVIKTYEHPEIIAHFGSILQIFSNISKINLVSLEARESFI